MHKCWPNPRNFDPKTSTTHPELELDHVSGIVSENRVINRAIGLYFVLATMSHPFFGFSASGLGNTTNIQKAIKLNPLLLLPPPLFIFKGGDSSFQLNKNGIIKKPEKDDFKAPMTLQEKYIIEEKYIDKVITDFDDITEFKKIIKKIEDYIGDLNNFIYGNSSSADGTTDDPAYEAAVSVFYDRHLCRIPQPQCLLESFAQLAADPTVYHTMNGPSEFHVIGSLKTWDIRADLAKINVPTLLVSGQFDEATPAIVSEIHSLIPGSTWELFPESSHTPHIEEPARY